MDTITLKIPGISCGHCVMTIKREAGMIKGVQFISGDIAGKTATFEVESEAALAELKKALAEAGYEAA